MSPRFPRSRLISVTAEFRAVYIYKQHTIIHLPLIQRKVVVCFVYSIMIV